MDTLSIYPPFSEDDVHELMKTPVAIFMDGEEKNRGMVISVNLYPTDKRYSVILDIDFSEYEGCTLGFIKETNSWIFTEEALNERVDKKVKPFVIDLRSAASIICIED